MLLLKKVKGDRMRELGKIVSWKSMGNGREYGGKQESLRVGGRRETRPTSDIIFLHLLLLDIGFRFMEKLRPTMAFEGGAEAFRAFRTYNLLLPLLSTSLENVYHNMVHHIVGLAQ